LAVRHLYGSLWEKEKNLDDCEIEAHVIVYIDSSKGWMFWIPTNNRVECSAWAQFAND
jgi:hypothetical protein